jgi:hypothetical protein
MKPMTMRLKVTTYEKQGMFRKPKRVDVVTDFGGNTSENIKTLIKALYSVSDESYGGIFWGEYDESITLDTLLMWLEHNARLDGTLAAQAQAKKDGSPEEIRKRINKGTQYAVRKLLTAVTDAVANELNAQLEEMEIDPE